MRNTEAFRRAKTASLTEAIRMTDSKPRSKSRRVILIIDGKQQVGFASPMSKRSNHLSEVKYHYDNSIWTSTVLTSVVDDSIAAEQPIYI